MIVGPIPAQMDDFCDLHGTPDTPVSRIVTVKGPGSAITAKTKAYAICTVLQINLSLINTLNLITIILSIIFDCKYSGISI